MTTEESSTVVPDWLWKSHNDHLVGELISGGYLGADLWEQAFRVVPRHLFVPRYWRLDRFNRPDTLVDPTADPALRVRWLADVYSDKSLVTAWSPSMIGDRAVRLVTSSASQPSVVASMLQRLELGRGQRVLEIGTGTGYNTALLCQYLGSGDSVLSVEIDPATAVTARDNLIRGGYHPRVVSADAATAEQIGAGYDRIIATCAIDAVPDNWIRALKPGGLLVAPGAAAGALLLLRKTGDDRLDGRIDPFVVAFMELRHTEVYEPGDGDNFLVGAGCYPRADSTSLDPAVLDDERFRFWLATEQTRLRLLLPAAPASNATYSVYTSGHRASVCRQSDVGPWRVDQDEGQLWAAVEQAWVRWTGEGRPRREQIAVTARPGGTMTYRSHSR